MATPVNKRHEEILKSIYYSPSEPASFSSVDRLYREANSRDPTINRSIVESFLAGELTYTLHRRIVRRFKRNPIIADFHTDQAQADLIDIQKFAPSNHGMRYILTVIDVFSKMAFAAPLKSKKSGHVAHAFVDLFQVYRPTKLQTDEGKEFTNKEVQQVLKDNFITFFIAKNEVIKCAVVERFQRTLMSKIQKFMTSKGTSSFIEHLDDFVRAYNDTYHRSIGMTPFQAANHESSYISRKLYGFDSRRQRLKSSIRKNPRLGIGTHVRVPYRKHQFEKGYKQNFSDEIFTIDNSNRMTTYPFFSLKTYDGRDIPGKFYSQELATVRDNDHYRVRILREKGRGRSKQFLVEFENLSDPPRWMKSSDLLPIS